MSSTPATRSFIYVNADGSVAYAGTEDIPLDHFVVGTEKVEPDLFKLTASLPPSITTDTIDQLAHQGYYFHDWGKTYEFSLEPIDVDKIAPPAS